MPIADAFFEYIKSIAMFIIFYTMVDLIMPNNSFKKYLNLILGLIMIILIITPLSRLVNSNPDAITESVFAAQNKLDKNVLQNEKSLYDQKQKDLIILWYKEQLGNQIILLLNQKHQIVIESVQMDVNEDDTQTSFGQILSVTILLAADGTSDVSSGQSGQKENELIQNAKKTISDFYNMDKANIHITM